MDPSMTLVSSALEAMVAELAANPENAGVWSEARQVLAHHSVQPEDDPELEAAIQARNPEALTAIVAGWTSGKRLMLVRDRDVLKRAMKAFRKSLKLTVLDAESKVGGSPMSSGIASNIVGIRPPDRYPREVWDELVRQKRMVADRGGAYGLAPGQ